MSRQTVRYDLSYELLHKDRLRCTDLNLSNTKDRVAKVAAGTVEDLATVLVPEQVCKDSNVARFLQRR